MRETLLFFIYIYNKFQFLILLKEYPSLDDVQYTLYIFLMEEEQILNGASMLSEFVGRPTVRIALSCLEPRESYQSIRYARGDGSFAGTLEIKLIKLPDKVPRLLFLLCPSDCVLDDGSISIG